MTPADRFNAELLAALPKLRGFCRAKFGQDAADLEQEAVTKALANRHRYAPDTNMAGWLKTIAFNSFVGRLRKERRMIEGGTHGICDLLECPHQANPDIRLDLAKTLATIDTLSPKLREAMVCVVIEGEDYADMSERTGVPIGSIKANVHRARNLINPERNPLR